MKRYLCTLLLVISLLAPLSFGQSGSEAQIKRVEQGLLPVVLIKGEPGWSIAERMKHYKVPGLSIAVIKDFKIAWARGYGLKDVQTNEAVTTETLFQAGSISKSVNAAVAMKKVEQGKISLDEDINNKLTTWKLPDNELTAKKKVTLREILSHTAGTTVHGFPGYAVNEKIPTLPQVLDGVPPANTPAIRVDLEPGTQFRYSGGGITIAQLAITDIEKRPYPEIAGETVLTPLGMTNSTYNQPLPADWRKKAATGYRGNGEEVEGKIHVYPEMAAAGLWTTPTDLAKFAIEMQLSLAGRSNKILKKETVALMTTGVLQDVGLGFFIQRHGDALYFGHDGADEGFRAQMLVSRDKGYGVVAMTNSDNGEILDEIVRGVAREYNWEQYLPTPYEVVKVEPNTLQKYAGKFQLDADTVLTVKTAGEPANKLIAEATSEPPFELLPISSTTFIRRDQHVKIEFVGATAGGGMDGNGAAMGATASAARIVLPRRTAEAPRVSAVTSVPFELLLNGKISEGIDGYRAIKQSKPNDRTISEDRLNRLGYVLMQQKKLPEAIALFKLNVEFYPGAWNTYDSLGEAYMNNGDKELAITNYKKSLELNPGNGNATMMLKKLQ